MGCSERPFDMCDNHKDTVRDAALTTEYARSRRQGMLMGMDSKTSRGVIGATAALGVAVALSGCIGPLRPAATPVRTLQLAPAPPSPGCLFVFLPGRGDRAEVYQREGFATPLGEHGLVAEAVSVDLHVGYYARRIAHQRLHDDVITPARSRGVRQVWLVGVSMGGLGTLIYDRYFPGEVTGTVLLAPFLGDEKVIDEITAAGGLARWEPKQPVAADDWARDIWSWLRRGPSSTQPMPRLVLGYGTRDSLAPANRLLAATLPEERVFTADGGHDWQTWDKLWRAMLASGQVGPDCR
jgi:pimeloyl-ACP methyl ester carboxylesterase